MDKNKEMVPRFESDEQEAEYWDAHSPLDLVAEPEAQEVRVRRPKDRPITIRLDSETRQKLNKLAAARGVGPSTLARSILVSAIATGERLPVERIRLEDLADLLERNLPQAVRDQAQDLVRAISIGGPRNPAFLLYEQQIKELGELGLRVVSVLLSMYGVRVITEEHAKYEEMRTLVQSGT